MERFLYKPRNSKDCLRSLGARKEAWNRFSLQSLRKNQHCQHLDLGFLASRMGFSHSSVGKESACSAGDLGLIPELERSPGEGNGNPLQYSYLENPMDRGTWQATVHGVTRVQHDLATKPPSAAASRRLRQEFSVVSNHSGFSFWHFVTAAIRNKCSHQGSPLARYIDLNLA